MGKIYGSDMISGIRYKRGIIYRMHITGAKNRLHRKIKAASSGTNALYCRRLNRKAATNTIIQNGTAGLTNVERMGTPEKNDCPISSRYSV